MANNMKKWAVLLLVLVCVFAFAACSGANNKSTTDASTSKADVPTSAGDPPTSESNTPTTVGPTEPVTNAPTPSEGLEFTLNDDGAGYTLTGLGTCKDTDVVIPSTYEGLPVTTIGAEAFSVSDVVSIYIPESIVELEQGTILDCTALSSVLVSAENPSFASIDGNLYSKDGKVLLLYAPAKPDDTFLIADGVTEITDYAFSYAENLTSITIPKGVTRIGYGAFYGCARLTSVTVEEGNTVYHSSGNCVIETESKTLYVGCGSSVIPDDGSVTSIGVMAFGGQESLLTLVIPEGVTSIQHSAFYGCANLKSLTIPDSVITVDEGAFCYCAALESIHIPEGVTSIDDYTFFGCASLTELTLPSTVTNIGYAAVYGCDSLQSLTLAQENDVLHSDGNCIIETATGSVLAGCNVSVIPDDGSVTNIAMTAFCGCTKITHMVIPEGVKTISTDAFYGCTAMTRIDLPSTLTSISEMAFESCTALTEIYYAGTEEQWAAVEKEEYWDYDCGAYTLHCSEPEFTLNEDGQSYTLTGVGSCTGANVVIPSTYKGLPVTAIGKKAFYMCETLTNVTIPQSVKTIGDKAFYYCSALTDVTIDGATEIGYMAFFDCEALVSVALPDTLLYIGDDAFCYCYELRQITLPNGLTHIGDEAFFSCVSLTEAVIPDSVTELGWSAFCYCDNLSRLVIGNGVTYIDDYTFYECFALSELTIGSNVTEIGRGAFEYCYGLTSVHLPASLEAIYSYAFLFCPLETVTVAEGNPVLHSSGNCVIETETKTLILGCSSSVIPDDGSVTIIGDEAFAGAAMTELVIPEGITTIGCGAFYECSSLEQITLPDSVTDVDIYPFLCCTALKSIKLSSGMTTIPEAFLTFCSELEEVEIPVSITSIDLEVFSACWNLKTIRYEGTVAEWEAIEKVVGWDWNTREITVYCSDGNYIKEESPYGNLDQKDVTVDDLTVDEDGNYFYGEYTVYIPITPHNNHWMAGSSLQESVEGGGTYDTTYWEDLLAAMDENGYVRLTTQTYEWLQTLIFGHGDEQMHIPCYLYIIPTPGEGLEFTLNDDGAGYTLTGLGTCKDANLVIPSTYKGLPVTAIGKKAFYMCETLTNVTIPQSVKTIGDKAFYYCSALTDVTIDGATEIGYMAFFDCEALVSVALPDTLLYIGDDAFCYCYELRQITLPNGLTHIGDEAFFSCVSLTEAVIPDSVTELGWSAFCYCDNLSRLVIGNGITVLEDYTFYECFALSELTIGSNVTEIGYGVFGHCYGLTSVTIPASVEKIYSYAFFFCPLETITVAEGNPVLHGSGNCVIETETKTLILGCGGSVIPDDGSVTSIGNEAFAGTTITELVIPEGITTIGHGAFYECHSLERITLPDSVTSVDIYPFLSCTSLKSVKLSSGMTTIPEAFFGFCSELEEVEIPVGITSIDLEVFSACWNLKAIRYGGTVAEWEAIEKTVGWDWNTHEITVYCSDGNYIKEENPFGNLDQKDVTVADLTVDEDGNYFYGEYAVYIPITQHNNHRMAGNSLQEWVESDSYYDTTYWEDLLAAMDEDGYVRLTTQTYEWLLTLISGRDEDESLLPCYLYIVPGK